MLYVFSALLPDTSCLTDQKERSYDMRALRVRSTEPAIGELLVEDWA